MALPAAALFDCGSAAPADRSGTPLSASPELLLPSAEMLAATFEDRDDDDACSSPPFPRLVVDADIIASGSLPSAGAKAASSTVTVTAACPASAAATASATRMPARMELNSPVPRSVCSAEAGTGTVDGGRISPRIGVRSITCMSAPHVVPMLPPNRNSRLPTRVIECVLRPLGDVPFVRTSAHRRVPRFRMWTSW